MVIVSQAGEQVRVRQRAQPHALNDGNSTYLIVGEVLWADIGSWIASEGAKNVVVVSSNAEAHPKAPSLTENVAARGCRLRFMNCNVWYEESLLDLLSHLSASLPLIRGVVRAGSDPILEVGCRPAEMTPTNSPPTLSKAARD